MHPTMRGCLKVQPSQLRGVSCAKQVKNAQKTPCATQTKFNQKIKHLAKPNSENKTPSLKRKSQTLLSIQHTLQCRHLSLLHNLNRLERNRFFWLLETSKSLFTSTSFWHGFATFRAARPSPTVFCYLQMQRGLGRFCVDGRYKCAATVLFMGLSWSVFLMQLARFNLDS